jgi:DNA-binding CsgD family transcriptional regulator
MIAAVVFVQDPLRAQRPLQATLHAHYNLTPAECRVALLLCDGLDPRQIANLVGVTYETVRSQLKSIFSKTSTRRQAELIRLLLNQASPPLQAKHVS